MFAFNNRAVECFFWSKCVWEVEATFACANIAASLESLVKNCLTLYRRVRKQTNMNPVLLKSESNLERFFFFALARPTEYDRWYNDDKFSSNSFLNVLYIYIYIYIYIYFFFFKGKKG